MILPSHLSMALSVNHLHRGPVECPQLLLVRVCGGAQLWDCVRCADQAAGCPVGRGVHVPESQESGIDQRCPMTSGSQPPSRGLSFLLYEMGTRAPYLDPFGRAGPSLVFRDNDSHAF